jgi:hypothetical protein
LNNSTTKHTEVTMSNNKQSSVEWFSKESWKLKVKFENKEITIGEYGVTYVDLLTQAKAMHKEEIMKSFQEGQEIPPLDDTKDEYSPMNYYNETFGGNK